jgi:tryptophan synthase alpha chain
MAGDPTLAESGRIVRAALEAGADAIELGVPFSDPLADGATIQRAGERALRNGVGVAEVIALARELATEEKAAVLLMGYANPFMRYGLARLTTELSAAGAAGVIVPDLPDDEAGEIDGACAGAGLVRISLIAPTTPDERLARLVPRCVGFVYCVSLTGVTGSRETLAPEVHALVGRVRPYARVPIAVGFGISRPEHVTALRGIADAVVVGSALADAAASTDKPARAVGEVVAGLARAARV